MILRSVTLQDFGVYAGTTTLDLAPRTSSGHAKPIVLIGGKNGVGKTTFLEAVRLALYGRRALGSRVGQTEYDGYLRDRVNWRTGNAGASVALEFDYAEAGTIHRYLVRREWATRGRSVVETLDLLKDGVTMTAVPQQEWQNFLQELIPPGVSQLFFFDGEKISEIAEGRDDEEQLGTAIRALLGMDLVARLRVDLSVYMARHQKDDPQGLETALRAVERDILVAREKVMTLGDEVAELSTQRESQARATEQVRRQFVSEGGDAAVHRDGIEAELDAVRRARTRGEQELREAANKLLPFAMAPRVTSAFRQALLDAGGGGHAAADSAFARAIESWRDAEGSPRAADWTPDHWSDLLEFVKSNARGPRPYQDCPAVKEVGDGAATIARLDELEAIVRPRAHVLLAEFDRLDARSRELEAALARADNASAGLMLEELQLSERRLGATEAVLNSRNTEWQLLKGQLVTLERDQKRLMDEQAGSNKVQRRSALAARASLALAAYEDRLLRHKLGQLRGEFVRLFNHLARKETPVSDMEIDPSTFATALIDGSGRATPKASLSEGEKQIYAISMLWALARTSGRPLPMIIDTPLARLDSDHRRNIVERYFPEASHQVIILSTDTEIDAGLLENLSPSISHSYLLEFDDELGSTSASEGYFDGADRTTGAARALQQA